MFVLGDAVASVGCVDVVGVKNQKIQPNAFKAMTSRFVVISKIDKYLTEVFYNHSELLDPSFYGDVCKLQLNLVWFIYFPF